MDQEKLYRYFAGEAGETEKKEVLDWVDASPGNRRELLRDRQLFDSLLMLGGKASRPATAPRSGRSRILGAVSRYAAAVLLTAGVCSAYFLGGRWTAHATGSNIVSVQAGQRVEVALPDGTKVQVNALSRLEYPAVFSGGVREVKLTGEAFFEVAHDPSNPFIVQAGGCSVQALGTSFNVDAYGGGGEFIASLVTGRIRVTDNLTREAVELQPGERTRYDGGKLVVETAPRNEAFLWRDGIIAYESVSFDEMMREFEKYFGVKIHNQRTKTPEKLFSGKIRVKDGLDHAMWVLQRSDNFTYRWSEGRDEIFLK